MKHVNTKIFDDLNSVDQWFFIKHKHFNLILDAELRIINRYNGFLLRKSGYKIRQYREI